MRSARLAVLRAPGMLKEDFCSKYLHVYYKNELAGWEIHLHYRTAQENRGPGAAGRNPSDAEMSGSRVSPALEPPSEVPTAITHDDEDKALDNIAGKWLDRQKWFNAWQHGELKERDFGDTEIRGLRDFETYRDPENNRVLQVLVVNWNMHGKSSAAREAPCKLFPRACPHHLYVVGTAECEKSIPKAVFNPKKKTWEKSVRSALDGCTCIAEASLAATHLTVQKAGQHGYVFH